MDMFLMANMSGLVTGIIGVVVSILAKVNQDAKARAEDHRRHRIHLRTGSLQQSIGPGSYVIYENTATPQASLEQLHPTLSDREKAEAEYRQAVGLPDGVPLDRVQ